MSSAKPLDDALGKTPEFDLEHAYDQRYHPRKITVYEHGEDIDVRWLTVPIDWAVPVEECR